MKSFILKTLVKILKTLSRLMIWRYKPGLIGVTGSVGKTSTKEMIKTVLSGERLIRASSASFNNELGLPLNILGGWNNVSGKLFWLKVLLTSLGQIIFKNPKYPEILILEYGVDHPGDMKYLLSIARPQIGLVTAVPEVPVHLEFFPSRESLAREKAKLLQALPATGFAVLNADDATVLNMKSVSRAHAITFGFADSADVRISNFEDYLKEGTGGVRFKLNYGGSFVPVNLEGSLGKGQSYGAAAAAAIGLIFGINLVKIAERLGNHKSPVGRLRIIPGIKESVIIDDTYNASPIAVKEALGVLQRLRASRKIAVLGDMLELGKFSMEAHGEIGKFVAESANILITLGQQAKFIAEKAERKLPKGTVFSFNNIKEAGIFLQEKIRKGDLILIKGSQSVRMEKIVKEVMAEPEKAKELLVRQNKVWLKKPGMYD